MRGGGVSAVHRARERGAGAAGNRDLARRPERALGAPGSLHRRGLGPDAGLPRLPARDRRPFGAAPRDERGRRHRGRKLRAALGEGLTPIVCVGETLGEREAGRTAEVLVRQAQAAYSDLSQADSLATVVAYE